ncbi:MFS transporter, PAT family, solute carrier family 33 (acetyl-CoA transporter), member 1 [Paragonimus westermani]|uniref:MFS transporter, PAT family, solute carrier family 33 (Acetyl-CoA transporter), member 1 n=1 Tax=Paragonimus westermani TaxID=34504 RepID=A0A5J4NLP1_9TREM|nr:MFS transporter, PAT family, solute carrier family 33 (acetyl-CoA transporter), member 1 [Paragonimus westermani]
MVVRRRQSSTMVDETNDHEASIPIEGECCHIQNDFWSICLLLILYLLQGIPLGLTAAVPLILQADSTTPDYQKQATFSLALWPFSLKILWAPLVDAIYSTRFGRRKSWLIPIQYAIGIDLLVLASHVDDWLGREPGNPSGKLGVANPVNVYALTAAFFGLTLLAATQDIVVDGWALTMLSRRNVAWASTCNTVGQPLGYVVAYLVFIILESADISNTYLRSTPVPDRGLVTFSGFLYFWGVVFMVATTLVAVLKHEENSTVTKPVQDCLDGVAQTVSNAHAVKRLKARLKSPRIRARNRNAVLELTEPTVDHDEDNDEVTQATTIHTEEDEDAREFHPNTLATDATGTSSGVIEVFPDDRVEHPSDSQVASELSLIDTYRITISVLCLRPLLKYIAMLFVVRNCSLFTYPHLPSHHLHRTHHICGHRLIYSGLAIPLLYCVSYFRQIVPGQPATAAGFMNHTVAMNGSFSMPHLDHGSHYAFSKTFYFLFLVYSIIGSVFSNFMFVSQMAFHARISDPIVGGSYMTLLNTAANLAGSLPQTVCLSLIEPLSVQNCQDADVLKAGLASLSGFMTPGGINKTLMSSSIPSREELEQLGQLWLSQNATCSRARGVRACHVAGGECVSTVDGFYVLVLLGIVVGLLVIPTILRPLAHQLDALPLSAFSFRPSALCPTLARRLRLHRLSRRRRSSNSK